jgi:hypothetical protein
MSAPLVENSFVLDLTNDLQEEVALEQILPIYTDEPSLTEAKQQEYCTGSTAARTPTMEGKISRSAATRAQ